MCRTKMQSKIIFNNGILGKTSLHLDLATVTVTPGISTVHTKKVLDT